MSMDAIYENTAEKRLDDLREDVEHKNVELQKRSIQTR
jgi:tetrahydromethanopterin S-methyltransferase subunit G